MKKRCACILSVTILSDKSIANQPFNRAIKIQREHLHPICLANRAFGAVQVWREQTRMSFKEIRKFVPFAVFALKMPQLVMLD